MSSPHDRMSNIMSQEVQTKIVVRVQPNASQNQAQGFKDGVLYVRIAAPPVKGKANQELIKFLSDILGVSKSNLTIEKGMTGKRKVICISGLTQDQVMRSRLMK
jgi:uncharacterized protein (TIGR00251 family)